MDFGEKIIAKYPYLTNDDIESLVNRAKSICIEQVYPADLSINYANFDWDGNARYDMWILDCVDELIERAGISTVLAYKENGMSWTFDRAGVSQALLDRLPRMARAVGYSVPGNGV